MEWLLAVLLKPFVALVFFAFAFFVARIIGQAIPESKAKSTLYDRTLMKRHPWKVGLGFLLGSWAVIGLIAFLVT